MKLFTKTSLVTSLCLFVLLAANSVKANELDSKIYQDDWKSPEAIIHAMYETISAVPGQQRNWPRFRALFFENAQILMAMESV